MSEHRVLIVYRYPIFQDVIRAILAAEPSIEVVGTAGGPEEAQRCVLTTEPDAVIIDCSHYGGGEAAASWPCKFLRRAESSMRIIILDLADTGMTTLRQKYVDKVTPAELIAAICEEQANAIDERATA